MTFEQEKRNSVNSFLDCLEDALLLLGDHDAIELFTQFRQDLERTLSK